MIATKMIRMASLVTIGCATLISGCRPASKAATPARPPVQVSFLPAAEAQVVDVREFTGRTAAVETVDVRARVSGYLLQRPKRSHESGKGTARRSDNGFSVLAREGERVTIDAPLFEIDPEPYRLALAQAKGNLDAAKAQLVRLGNEKDRLKGLFQTNAVSQSDFDLAIANYQEALSRIENQEATTERAKLDLVFTQVRSPIDGIVGRSSQTEGNLVTADTTVLTTIVSTDPIHVYFDVDESSFLEFRQIVKPGNLNEADGRNLTVQMALARDSDFPYQGTLDFLNNRTDPETGNTLLRAVFSNNESKLSPGLFARVQVPFSEPYSAILVPTRALLMDQEGRYVLVIDDENKLQRRLVRIGTSHGQWTAIAQGLALAEHVVVIGLQKARPGDTVSPIAMENPPPLPSLHAASLPVDTPDTKTFEVEMRGE